MRNTPWTVHLVVAIVLSRFALSYRMPNLTMEAKFPSGFRVFIPDQRGIEEFGFNANINEPLESYEPGEISAEVKEKTGRFWIFQDDHISLEPGDALYYWAYVVFRGVVFKRVRQKWVCINFVREFSNVTVPRRPNPRRPPFHHPFGPFTPHFPWSNTTTSKASPPTTPRVEITTSKRPTETTTSNPPSPKSTTPTTTLPPTTQAPEIKPKVVTTTRVPQPETTTVQGTTVPQTITTTRSPKREITTTGDVTTTGIPQPETTTGPPADVTTTRIPQPETTTGPPADVTTTRIPQPETTTGPSADVTTTRIPQPETTTGTPADVTTTRIPAPETTTTQVTTPEIPTTTRIPEPETTPSMTTAGRNLPTTMAPTTSGLVTPNFCDESVPTAPTEETISTTMSDVTTPSYAPPVYWPSNREDCLNVWSPTYRPFMTRLKMTKSVIVLECQVMSQKRKMSRVRTELFNLSKFNFEVEARLEALEKKVFGHLEASPSQDEESER